MICARATLLLSGIGLALAAIPAASIAQAVPVYSESASDALARNMRTLADRPKDFDALVAAARKEITALSTTL